MGAGIAVQFRERWPDMYEAYRKLCKTTTLPGGYVMPWYRWGNKPYLIYNLITHGMKNGTNLADVGIAVNDALAHAADRNIRQLGLPRIGTGIGGLDWKNVRQVLREAGENSPVELVVVTLPEPDMKLTPGEVTQLESALD